MKPKTEKQLINEKASEIEKKIYHKDEFFIERELSKFKANIIQNNTDDNIVQIENDLKILKCSSKQEIDKIIAMYHPDDLDKEKIKKIRNNIQEYSLKDLYGSNNIAAVRIILSCLFQKYTTEKKIDLRTDLIRYMVDIQSSFVISDIEDMDFLEFFEIEANQELWKRIRELGYYSGFLKGINNIELPEVKEFINHSISVKHGQKNPKKEDLYKELIELVQRDVKRLYQNGETRLHHVIATEIRKKVRNIIDQLRSGKVIDKTIMKDPYTIAIQSIYNHISKWEKIDKDLNKKKKNDFFLTYVKEATPNKYVKGIKYKTN